MSSYKYGLLDLGPSFSVTSVFGNRISPITQELLGHKGVDFHAANGTKIPAIADGVVYLAPAIRVRVICHFDVK